MTILALDTTSQWGGIAIRKSGQEIAATALQAPDGFGHLIFQAVQEVLSRAQLDLTDIDCFAAASGPGSFTGVRIGLSAVKGLAAATGKPAVAVSNLKAMALYGRLPLRATLLDARRGETYAAVYDAGLHAVEPETVANLADWLPTTQSGRVRVYRPGWILVAGDVAGNAFRSDAVD